MPIEQTLEPAFISVVYDGEELNIVDMKFELEYDNKTSYETGMICKDGKKGYLLRKGVSVMHEGEISVIVTDTADGKQSSTIDFLKKKMQEAAKTEKPDDYVKSIVCVCKDPGEEQFLSVSFRGYIKQLEFIPTKEGNAFVNYKAVFEVFDPLTMKIES